VADCIPDNILKVGILTEYPSGFIVVCLLAGGLYTLILYYNDLRKKSRPWLLYSMAAMRFTTVTIIAFLLLSPYFRASVKVTEKPLVVIGIDNSQSVAMLSDSLYYRDQFPAAVSALVGELGKKFEVKTYDIGSALSTGFSTSFKEPQTDLSVFFNEIRDRHANRYAAAVILMSDGIYNKGSDPFYAAKKIPYPVYTVALGDTSRQKDVNIKKVTVNKTVYKNDIFSVECLAEVTGYQGETVRLDLYQGEKLLHSNDFQCTSENTIRPVRFNINASETGLIRYRLKLTEMENEITVRNNMQDFIVEVKDARLRISLVYDLPHPDIQAITRALQSFADFDLKTFSFDQWTRRTERSDLSILYQVPSVDKIQNLELIPEQSEPMLFVIGSKSDINSFNKLNTGLIINGFKNSFAESSPQINAAFPLFTVNAKETSPYSNFPPLFSPFGVYQVSPVSEVLIYQKISGLVTQNPLVLFSMSGTGKAGVIAGENFWRWRISSFIQTGNYMVFDRIMEKTVRFLASKEEKQRLSVFVKGRIPENEPVEMEALLRNAAFELITDPEMQLTITDSAGNAFPYVFGRSGNSYFLNTGIFAPGIYAYKVTAKQGSEAFINTGRFMVEKLNVESLVLRADHDLLYKIAQWNEGEMVRPSEIASLAERISAREDIRTVSYERFRLTDLTGNTWLFLLILALLTAEWVLRKREGI